METRVRHFSLALSGQALLLGGLVLVVASFFLLPLWVSTFCFDTCQPAPPIRTVTAWEFSLNGLAHWYVTPIPNTLALIVVYFPLCAGAVLLLGGAIFLAHPGRMLMRWLTGVWVAEIFLLIALVSLIFFLIAQPDMGYWGMGVSALLSGIGLLLIRVGRPELRRAQ